MLKQQHKHLKVNVIADGEHDDWLLGIDYTWPLLCIYIYIHIHVLACVYVIDYTCILFIVKYICNHIYIVVITLNSNNKHNNNDNNNTNNNNNTHDRNATVSHMQTPWMWTIHHNISIWTLKWKTATHDEDKSTSTHNCGVPMIIECIVHVNQHELWAETIWRSHFDPQALRSAV